MIPSPARAAAWAILFFSCALPPAGAHRPVGEGDALEVREVDSALASRLAAKRGARERARRGGLVTARRVKRLEEELQSIFDVLPKNEHGKLGSPAARYALHRHFRRSRGWLVHGLAPEGAAWGALSLAEVVQDGALGPVRGLFERRLNGSGFTLGETALLAATIEEIIREEASERLRKAFQTLGLPSGDEGVSRPLVENALDVFMMSYIINETVFTSEHLRSLIDMYYPPWPATQDFMHALLREAVAPQLPRGRSVPVTFQEAEQVVWETVESFGLWQERECIILKEALVKLEDPCPGRVELAAFYKSALGGKWQFAESTGYLRTLGALDETDAHHPMVVVPNYIAGPSNIISLSRLYSVACIDECDARLAFLERNLKTPAAAPEAIANLVGEARRLTPAVQRHLRQIARLHGGRVPLHGRLFAQWLHHVYPRECAFPATPGTTKQVTPEDYGKIARAFERPQDLKADERRLLAEASASPQVAECTPWTNEEELVAPILDEDIKDNMEPNQSGFFLGSSAAYVAAFVAFIACLAVLAVALPRLSARKASSAAAPLAPAAQPLATLAQANSGN